MWFLSKTYQKLPNDSFFEEMDPLLKLYCYEHWVEDQQETYLLHKNSGILIGSFFNPEAAKQMLEEKDNTFASSDEDFQETIKMVEEWKPPEAEIDLSTVKHRRKRRKLRKQKT